MSFFVRGVLDANRKFFLTAEPVPRGGQLPLGSASAMAPSVRIVAAGVPSVVGSFVAKSPTAEIPKGFAAVCESMRWPTAESWRSLADQQKTWFLHENGAYIYRNTRDGQWWIDEPSGGGVYVAKSDSDLPPTEGWVLLPQAGKRPLPQLEVKA